MGYQESKSMTKQKESAPSYEYGGQSAPPPAYTSLPEAVAAGMNSLSIGNPQETISVPMILSTEHQRKRDLFLPTGKRPVVTQTVITRKMKREHYLKHYARDAQGNYVGTEQPAVDAGLVFVFGKSSNEEILEQVRKVASEREHDNADFTNGLSYVNMAAWATM